MKTNQEYEICSISLNVQELTRRGFPQNRISRLEEACSGLTLKRVLSGHGPSPELLTLKGPNNEFAYLRHEISLMDADKFPSLTQDTYTLVIELPLSATARKQRQWLKAASGFYKHLVSAKTELVSPGHGPLWIKKKGYKSRRLGKYRIKELPFSGLKEPYGSKSPNSAFKRRRDEWIRKEYLRLRQRDIKGIRAFETIQERLFLLPRDSFGPYFYQKRGPFKLNLTSIRSIALRKQS